MTDWKNKIKNISRILSGLSFTDEHGRTLGIDNAFLRLRQSTIEVRNKHKTVFAIGNGASASMSSHFAADLAKNGKLHTQVFSDLALITAISNDIDFNEVFAEPLRRSAHEGDLLVAISSSGRSENVLRAVREAKKLNLEVVTLSAMDENNPLRSMGILNIYLPAKTYGDAETAHAAILHYWIDLVVEQPCHE